MENAILFVCLLFSVPAFVRFFELKPHARSAEYGDISERRALREKLQCKSFDWYMQTVYPQLLEHRDQMPVAMKGNEIYHVAMIFSSIAYMTIFD